MDCQHFSGSVYLNAELIHFLSANLRRGNRREWSTRRALAAKKAQGVKLGGLNASGIANIEHFRAVGFLQELKSNNSGQRPAPRAKP